MKWLVLASTILFSMTTAAHTKELSNISTLVAHTGEQCHTIQNLKKDHPSSRIYWETIEGKKCYHVHVNAPIQLKNDANPFVIPKDVAIPKSKTTNVLDYFMSPNMKWFYDDYTRHRNF